MDNDKLFTTPSALSWQLFDGPAPPELNPTPPGYLNLNWDHSMTDNNNNNNNNPAAHFESALSSAISSPSSAAPAAESVVIRELIGRLGSICNSGEISPTSRYHSTNTSCYSTPLNSPPKLNLSMMDPNHLHQQRQPISDPGFAERAARFSALAGGRNFQQFGFPDSGKLSRVSSSNEIRMRDGVQFHIDNGELGSPSNEPSPSGRIITGGDSNVRKRKAAVAKAKGKAAVAVTPLKVAEEEEEDPKRSRSSSGDDDIKPRAENGDKKQGKESNAKTEEPLKDYIHVRARRGQATDSHSLAERVRREKISERMKFLQDLVPGCNKVTGKAVMLDEIINYVQSLQRQVEFLSMKLATVNPRLDINMENLVTKEMNQAHGPMAPHSEYSLEPASTGFPYIHHPQGTPLMANRLQSHYSSNHLDSGLRPNLSMQMPQFDGFGDVASQIGTFWEDLHSVVQMGFGQNQDVVFSSPQSLNGSLSSAHMKVEL